MVADTTYDVQAIETKWAAAWENAGCFRMGTNVKNRRAFGVMLPPPNITGTLHMGHGFQQTLIDILVRHHRMRGYNVLWQPGMDHAGIATQLIVEKQLAQTGQTRQQLGRDALLQKIWQWKQESSGTISQQMRRMGFSCDWSRECFTLDTDQSQIVTHTFVKLYKQGLIYRGQRLVNWDPYLKTAISDLEVVNTEEEGVLFFIRYAVADSTASLTVATTRPETLFGDVAVAVHPHDPTWQSLIGQWAIVPITHQKIPIIADTAVDAQFGTGCVKITPAHDHNDYKIGQRHHLPLLNILTEDGRLNDHVPAAFRGYSCAEAREKVVAALHMEHALVSYRPHKMVIPRSDRSHTIVEPYLTKQWFVELSHGETASAGWTHITSPAQQAVAEGHIRFVPEHWTAVYSQWLHNIEDWCISRQLWWGHQIPAWYGENGQCWVAHGLTEARMLATRDGYTGEKLERDPDVLDTWFSSALWPFSTLQWTPHYPARTSVALELYLPSSVLVTGFDIIFFWVARMIMLTRYMTGKIPFKTVYIHGLIRDAEGRKMSKSKGNVLDPLDLVHGISIDSLLEKQTKHLMHPQQKEQIIQKIRQELPAGMPAFGADALRFTFAALASPGRDIRFDTKRCRGYHHFCHKLWNAGRFVFTHCQHKECGFVTPELLCNLALDREHADYWILERCRITQDSIGEQLLQYRFDVAANTLYHFVWHDLCDWYFEIAKINLVLHPHTAVATRNTLVTVLNATVKIAHPFVPFITEELWQTLHNVLCLNPAEPFVMISPYMELPFLQNKVVREWITTLQEWTVAIRTLRSEMKINPSEPQTLVVCTPSTSHVALLDPYAPYLAALANLSSIEYVENWQKTGTPLRVVQQTEFTLHIRLTPQAERARLGKELKNIEKTIMAATTKLANTAFIEKAPPHVVQKVTEELERSRIRQQQLEQYLQNLA